MNVFLMDLTATLCSFNPGTARPLTSPSLGHPVSATTVLIGVDKTAWTSLTVCSNQVPASSAETVLSKNGCAFIAQ